MINKRIAYFFWVISFLMIPSLLIAQQLSDSVSNDIDPIYNTTDSSFNKQDSSLLVLDSTQIKQESKVIAYLLRKDSLDVYTYSFFRDSVNYIHYQYIDTLNHLSDQYNPTKYLDVFYNDLGNVGSAQENQVFSPSTKTGLNIGMNNFNAFLWLPKDIEVYDIQTPYTDLFYLMGPKKENSLKITHAQSFLKEQLSVNLKFQLYNSIGFYNHQRNDVKSFYGGMGYRTKNSRYKINAQYYHNKQVLDENGGIVNLSDFENNAESNRQIIDTKLSTGQNLIRVSGLALEQSFYISKPEPDFSQISDTNTIKYNGYSVTHFKKPYFDPVSHLGQIRYYFNFERNNLKYTDQEQESSIYDGIPFYPTYDSAIFFDTIGTRKYQNELIYSNSDYIDDVNHPKFINYFFGGRQEYNEYYQDSTKKYFNNYALIGGVFLNISPYLSVLSDAAFYYGDYLNGDLLFNGKVFLNIKKNYLTGGVQISHRSADWMFQEFSSSRFTWHNSFDKTDEQKLYVKIERKNILLFAQVRNISNYIFFNEQIVPEQISENIQHILIKAEYDFRYASWGADFRVIYQSVSNSEVVRIPDFSGKTKLFYQHRFFNNALDLEVGVELYYFTKYYANKYMPAIRSFHLQNEQQVGEHLFADVYLNAKIGTARLFLKYDHFNSSFMAYDYYASPDYPAQDGAFRFGVSWLLFN